MKQTWSSGYEESQIANYAFNCKWEATEGWTWEKNGEKDCVGWLMNIFYGPAQGWQNGGPLAVLTKKNGWAQKSSWSELVRFFPNPLRSIKMIKINKWGLKPSNFA